MTPLPMPRFASCSSYTHCYGGAQTLRVVCSNPSFPSSRGTTFGLCPKSGSNTRAKAFPDLREISAGMGPPSRSSLNRITSVSCSWRRSLELTQVCNCSVWREKRRCRGWISNDNSSTNSRYAFPHSWYTIEAEIIGSRSYTPPWHRRPSCGGIEDYYSSTTRSVYRGSTRMEVSCLSSPN